jgi:hypothetical protein
MTTSGSRSFLVLCVGLLLMQPAAGSCGNLEMVEKNVAELDSINREAVSQIEGLPRNGTVDLKAYVTGEGSQRRIAIDEANTTIKAADGKRRQLKPAKRLTEVEVSPPTTDGKIELLEENGSPNKDNPGGRNVR